MREAEALDERPKQSKGNSIDELLKRVDPRIHKRTVMQYAKKGWKPGVDQEADSVLAMLAYFNRNGDPLDFGEELSRPDLPKDYQHDPSVQ